MPGFLYFLPTAKRLVDESDLKAAGLGYALRGKGDGVSSNHTYEGPGAAAGCVITINGDGVSPRYVPAEQTWRKGPDGAFWVGVETAARPGPGDLARKTVYAGQAVTLLDGNEWIIPRCYGHLDGRAATLPRVIDLDEDGETLITRPSPRFEKLCRGAYRFWQDFIGVEPEPMPIPARIELAIEALTVNYRVGKIEAIGLLGLWGTEEFGLILRAAIDADTIEQWVQSRSAEQKKSIP